MSVSVVIVNWNSGPLLKKCLHSLSLQTLKADAVFVVDNASSDGSADCVIAFPEYRLLLSGSNLGFAAGNNYAFRECNSEFVALLNPDAFPEPTWLEHLVAAAKENPKYAAFGSRQLVLERPECLDGIGDAYHLSGLVWRERHGEIQDAQDLVEREVFSPCAAAALFRRPALVAAGGFDEDYFCYLEDVDLGFRLRLAGHRAMYVPQAIVLHQGSATTGGQRSDFSVYHGHRNLVWTFVKNMPSVLFWGLLPLHLALNLFSLMFFGFRGQWQVIFRAKRDALRGLPRIWAKRRAVQRERVASLGEVWRILAKGSRR